MAPLLWGLGAMLVFIFAVRGVRLLTTDPLEHLAPEDRGLVKEPAQRSRRSNPLTRFGQRIGPDIAGLFGETYREAITQRVKYAQHPQFPTVQDFFAMKARLLLIVSLGIVAIVLLTQSYVLAFILFLTGFFLPDLVLVSAGKKRQNEIEEALPDFLDVLAVTVSAGLSFRGALQRVIERTEGPLAEEMSTTMRRMDVGTPRYEAFSQLRQRTKSESMDAFVTSMMQAAELGAPLVDALEQIALDMRRSRAQRARQEAAKASPKIAAVVTMIMVPGTMVLVMAAMWFMADLDLGEMLGGFS